MTITPSLRAAFTRRGNPQEDPLVRRSFSVGGSVTSKKCAPPKRIKPVCFAAYGLWGEAAVNRSGRSFGGRDVPSMRESGGQCSGREPPHTVFMPVLPDLPEGQSHHRLAERG